MKKIFYHQNSDPCADGTSAAALWMAFRGTATTIPVRYGVELDGLVPEPGCVFLDISPSTRFEEWRNVDPVVIDHHSSREATIKSFKCHLYPEEGDFASGASLTLRYLMRDGFRPSPALQKFVECIAAYDTWQKHHPDWDLAVELSSAVRFWGLSETTRFLLRLQEYSPPVSSWELFLEAGRIQEKRQAERVVETMKKARSHRVGLIHAYFVPTTGVPLNTGVEKIPVSVTPPGSFSGPIPTVLVGYSVRYDRVVYSMRTRHPDVDLGRLAGFLGGGGHRAAAGFSLPAGFGSSPELLWCDAVRRLEEPEGPTPA